MNVRTYVRTCIHVYTSKYVATYMIHSYVATETNCSYTVCVVHLAVILIWRFGRFSSDLQIKITANTVVLSQVLINSNDE